MSKFETMQTGLFLIICILMAIMLPITVKGVLLGTSILICVYIIICISDAERKHTLEAIKKHCKEIETMIIEKKNN